MDALRMVVFAGNVSEVEDNEMKFPFFVWLHEFLGLLAWTENER